LSRLANNEGSGKGEEGGRTDRGQVRGGEHDKNQGKYGTRSGWGPFDQTEEEDLVFGMRGVRE